jgi:hypothetical protein
MAWFAVEKIEFDINSGVLAKKYSTTFNVVKL